MTQMYEDTGKLGQEWMDSSLQSAAAFSKGMQAITVEATDCSKKTLENGSAVMERLLAAKSVEKVLDAQSD